MSTNEKELFKFENDIKYREKIIAKVHKEQDATYNKNIKSIESDIKKLRKLREQEIQRITNARWENIVGNQFSVNRTEGKVKINKSEVLFSSIKGAEINLVNGYRTVTTETGKSKKHASVGGAIAGGVIAGPLGAVAGGTVLGKTKTKSNAVTNQILTCTHLGVLVNIDGFVSEIVLVSNQIDQSSMRFISAQTQAQTIISQLGVLAKTPVPQTFKHPYEETSVKKIDAQIEVKNVELKTAIEDKPTYNLPAIYRNPSQSHMTDEEYLQYLSDTDAVRLAENRANAEAKKQQKEERKSQHNKRVETITDTNIQEIAKKTGYVIYQIVFWVLSIFVLLFSFAGFGTSGGTISGLLFLVTSLMINPFLTKLIDDKLFKFPRWISIIILFFGFIAGLMTYPVS